jgi:hypothetical protein
VPAPPAITCPKLQFVGVRGSGETMHDYDGFGKTVASIKDVIEKKVPGTASYAVDYEAINVGLGVYAYGDLYIESVHSGTTNLDMYLTDFIKDCPNTYVILAGYSQGAQVAGDEFAYLTAYEKSHIAALIMIGDPRFNPNQPQVDVGNYDKNLSGIYQIIVPDSNRVIPDAYVANVRSYCAQGDPVCNYSNRSLASCFRSLKTCPHMRYTQGAWLKEAANWAVKHWKSMPPLN